MEAKKSPKADLENKRTIFMQIGLVAVFSLVFSAFEWNSTETGTYEDLRIDDKEVEMEIMPITRTVEVKPPELPQLTDVMILVENDVELDDDLIIVDTEPDDDTSVDFWNMDVDEEPDDNSVFVRVEEMPEFPGGNAGLARYLANSVDYPVIAQENNIQGRVFVAFVINKDGSVTDVKISRGVNPDLDREALRVVREMPRWEPGKQRAKPVRVSFTVPISFVLQ